MNQRHHHLESQLSAQHARGLAADAAYDGLDDNDAYDYCFVLSTHFFFLVEYDDDRRASQLNQE